MTRRYKQKYMTKDNLKLTFRSKFCFFILKGVRLVNTKHAIMNQKNINYSLHIINFRFIKTRATIFFYI